jgi:predicted transcriptional regulator
MRPTALPQSTLFMPLTSALGTAARVRVLRVLVTTDAPLGIPALAREAGLNPRGVRTVARDLEELGVIAPGPGSRPTLMLRDAWPLASALRALFTAESSWRAALFADLRRLANGLVPPPIGVWIAGPHAAGVGTARDPLCLVVYGAPADLPAQRARLAGGLATLTARHDLPAPEVQTLNRGDLAALSRAGASTPSAGQPDGRLAPPLLLLAGTLPDLTARPPASGATVDRRATGPAPGTAHARADAEALARAAALANLLRTTPTLVPRALKAVRERAQVAPPRLRATLEEWATLLATQTPARLARLLTRDDARMTRLRQTLPFLDVLTPAERTRIALELGRVAQRQAGAR